MKILLYITLLLFIFSCGSENQHQLEEDSLYFDLKEKTDKERLENYEKLKRNIIKQRNYLFDAPNKDVSNYLTRVLTDSLFHFWYDTDWDFNGVTLNPQNGSIACGYFVTTTLLHAGFDLPRAKLAQQAASKIIETLCKKESIKTFSNGNLKGLKEYLKKSEDGLYIIGLDNHVGFIHKKDTSIVMIHSDAGNDMVCRERLDDCRPIVKSKFHMIGNFSGNGAVMEKWKNEKKIEMGN